MSAPRSIAACVSSSVSSSLAEPVPGTNGTRSPTSSATTRMAAIRSATVCALGSPVEPPIEMPCEPASSCHRTSARMPSWSTSPSAVKGVTIGAIDPRTEAGSERNLIVLPPSASATRRPAPSLSPRCWSSRRAVLMRWSRAKRSISSPLRPLLDHVEQLVVLLDAARGALGDVRERRAAGGVEQRPLALEDRQDVAVGAGAEQDLVEAPVEPRELGRVELDERVAQPVVDLAGATQVGGREVRHGEAEGDAFEHGHGFDRLGVAVEVDRRDGGADVAGERDVAVGLEAPDRLAHRDHAHAELAGEALDHQPVAGVVLAVEDRPQDRLVGVVGLGGRGAWPAAAGCRGRRSASHRHRLLQEYRVGLPITVCAVPSMRPQGRIIYDLRREPALVRRS